MDLPLDNARHLRYWQRCLRTLLPHQYTSNDSIRMTLGCFAVAAVDLLEFSKPGPEEPFAASAKPPIHSSTDRRSLRAWVLSCQHAGGGFTGGPTHVASDASGYDGFDFTTGQPVTGARSSANIAATLFALQLLALLSDDGVSAFAGVDRIATLTWLRQLQRKDGSFGELLDEVPDPEAPGKKRILIAGGSDMRYCYIAAMIRWMLRGGVIGKESAAWVEDIDVDAEIRYIRQGQTYDGGFAESSMHESHAGYAFCAIAALTLLGRPQQASQPSRSAEIISRGIPDIPALIRWLVSRQLPYDNDDDDDDDDDEYDDEEDENGSEEITPEKLLGDSSFRLIGFNGRCNKPADTCYTWWVCGTLSILKQAGFDSGELRWEPSRQFLMEKTQHIIGGFAKTPGGPPDLYHSYLGLAALATMGEPTLKSFDPAMCISLDAVTKVETARYGLLQAATEGSAERRSTLLRMGKSCWSSSNRLASKNGVVS